MPGVGRLSSCALGLFGLSLCVLGLGGHDGEATRLRRVEPQVEHLAARDDEYGQREENDDAAESPGRRRAQVQLLLDVRLCNKTPTINTLSRHLESESSRRHLVSSLN